MTETTTTETITLKSWTGRDGKVRRYLNCAIDLLGLDIERYKTGSVRFATLNGESISNADAQRILDAKVWLDSANHLHLDYWTARAMTEDEARAIITAKLAGAELRTI